VVAHSVRVAEARQDVSRVLDDPAVRAQVKKFGVEPQQLQKRVALLTESEVLELQSQIMPLAEQLEAAAQEGNRKKALIWVLVGVVAALTIAMFLYYS
jgi:hypothetical protein